MEFPCLGHGFGWEWVVPDDNKETQATVCLCQAAVTRASGLPRTKP